VPSPRPQPTALKVLRGNPGKRRLNHAEPIHPPLSTDCPPELVDPVARAEWDRIAPQLIACGQVMTVDRATLVGYCLKYAQWQALEREGAQHPFIVRSPNGYPLPNPALCMANKAFNLMLKAAIELGITPSSRSRVMAQPPAVPVTKWPGMLP
jgi:P27 family predicted phage terminase small subunit